MALEDVLERRIRHHIGVIEAYAGTLDVPGAAEIFEQDPMFSVFGLSGPRYLTARFGGGLITSIHRKIGDLFEDCVREVMIGCLGIPREKATYGAEVESGSALVTRTADCFIQLTDIPDPAIRTHVARVARSMRGELQRTRFTRGPRGIGFEIRGCYQSADSKRAQADDAMARHLSERKLVPLMLVFCASSNRSIMRRYQFMWKLCEGQAAYDAVKELSGFDLQAFLQERAPWIQGEIGRAFDRLTPES